MPTPRPKSASAKSSGSSAAARAVVDVGFIPVRAKLIELAAFFDRVERHGVAGDFRCAALRRAAKLLSDGKSERARRILEALSDPTTVPEEKSSGKAALGAWQPATKTTPRASGRAQQK